MAKSIRSKWRRKCRAVKRERYGQKELERLKKTLGIQDGEKVTDAVMENITDIANIVDATNVQTKDSKIPDATDEMETDDKQKNFSLKKLRNEHGTYPVWLHPRKIRKNKNAKKNKNKKTKSKWKS